MKKLLITAVAACAIIAGAAEFRIEAESIGERASWGQGVGNANIGGKLIWSNNKKGPENTAVGVYSCPEEGRYYVWVRTLSMNEGWRKTQVKINGKVVGKFGDEKQPGGVKGKSVLAWKRTLGATLIPAGELKVELIPLSTASRVDSLIFTTDQNFKPGEKDAVEEITELDCEY